MYKARRASQKNESAGVTRVVPHGASNPSPSPRLTRRAFSRLRDDGGAAGLFASPLWHPGRCLPPAHNAAARETESALEVRARTATQRVSVRGCVEPYEVDWGLAREQACAVLAGESWSHGQQHHVRPSSLFPSADTTRLTRSPAPLTCSSHGDPTCHTESKHGPSRGPASPDFLSHPCLRCPGPCRLSRFPSPAQPY